MKHLFLFVFFLIILCLVSCKFGLQEGFYRKNSVEKRASQLNDFLLYDVNGNELNFSNRQNYSFILISDVHFGANKARPEEKFLKNISKMSVKPDFCICLGDIAEHGLEEEYLSFNTQLVDELEKIGIPTYSVPGNHDLYNSGWNCYTKFNFPYSSFYRIINSGISYYFIDTASGSVSEPQFSELKKAMEKDVNQKFVFTHAPLYAENTLYFVLQDVEERNNLISLFAKNNVKLYASGHIHKYLITDFGSFLEISVPAYLDQNGWTIVTVDNATKNFTYKSYFLD